MKLLTLLLALPLALVIPFATLVGPSGPAEEAAFVEAPSEPSHRLSSGSPRDELRLSIDHEGSPTFLHVRIENSAGLVQFVALVKVEPGLNLVPFPLEAGTYRVTVQHVMFQGSSRVDTATCPDAAAEAPFETKWDALSSGVSVGKPRCLVQGEA